jgi:hypothetical protein
MEQPRDTGRGPVLARAVEYAANSPGSGPVLAKGFQAAEEAPGRGPILAKLFKMAESYGKGESEYRKGGLVKSSASKRADGIATKGKTKGRMI